MPYKNLEYISIKKQTTVFPKHFHETFCISLIHQGVEQIDFESNSLFSEAGSISITNPYEIHSNPIFDISTPLYFDTIYVPKDLMKNICNGKNIVFLNRKINNKKANSLFKEVTNAIDSKEALQIEKYLKQFINALMPYADLNKTEYLNLDFNEFKIINQYIEKNISAKFTLTELAQMANINKYGFAKKFKTFTGMSPMNYILMKKIFSSKQIINIDSDLTQIAINYAFTDLAHFSKTFKRYIGISPKQFQKSI